MTTPAPDALAILADLRKQVVKAIAATQMALAQAEAGHAEPKDIRPIARALRGTAGAFEALPAEIKKAAQK